METRTLTWRVEGEFMTRLAREKCYYDHDLSYAIQLLKGCMMTDKLSDAEVTGMAVKILNGEAELRGTYPGDDYGYFELEIKDERYSLSNLTSIMNEKKQKEKELQDLQYKFAFICENCDSYVLRKLNEQYREENDEHLCPVNVRVDKGFDNSSIGGKMLESYMKRQMADTNEPDYGWLEPSGKFHPADWGEHQEWACNYVLKLVNDGTLSEDDAPVDAGEWLVEEKGWVLLHNPAQGIPIITSGTIMRLTKAQKEFLYDYYIKRDCHKEANALYVEA